MSKKKISVIIPCYNEEENIEIAYSEVNRELSKYSEKYDFEIVFEDNGSLDDSEIILRKLAKQDKNVKVIFNSTNFGPERSITNLYMRSKGDAIIFFCCDMQEPPELIPQFIEEWEKGHDIVWGTKTNSNENAIKYWGRKKYYGLIDKLSDYKQYHQCIGFGLFTAKVRDIVMRQKMQDPEMSIRHIVGQYGFDVKLIPYTQRERMRGKSSYSFYRYYEFAISSVCMTSLKPLRYMTIMGILTAIGCILVSVFYFVYKLINWNRFRAGQAPLVIGLFFVTGIMLFCIGILGEYIAILIRRTTDKPIVVEKETLNMD